MTSASAGAPRWPPAIDTKTFMRASLVHDALCQLMRAELLPQSVREDADKVMRKICLEDGMARFRAWYAYKVVRVAGKWAAKPDLLTAL